MKYIVPADEFAAFNAKMIHEEEDILMMFDCTTDRLRDYFMNGYGFGWDKENKVVLFDTSGLEGVEATAILISAEYEYQGADRGIWRFFGLSGDDDVDYNSSYIHCAIQYCRVWAEQHPDGWEVYSNGFGTLWSFNTEEAAEAAALCQNSKPKNKWEWKVKQTG